MHNSLNRFHRLQNVTIINNINTNCRNITTLQNDIPYITFTYPKVCRLQPGTTQTPPTDTAVNTPNIYTPTLNNGNVHQSTRHNTPPLPTSINHPVLKHSTHENTQTLHSLVHISTKMQPMLSTPKYHTKQTTSSNPAQTKHSSSKRLNHKT